MMMAGLPNSGMMMGIHSGMDGIVIGGSQMGCGTEESKRDLTLTNGGGDDGDINIDLGKELGLNGGDMDDGTMSKM